MRTFDFVAIGDIVTDAFIRLIDASVHCDVDNENCMLSMRFGDKIPYEFVEEVVAVGNSANAAVAAARIGLQSALIAHVGSDQHGKNMLAQLTSDKVATDYVKVNEGMISNYHYVLWYDVDRTILVKHQEYPYSMPDMPPPKWIYLSSLGEHSLTYHDEIANYLAAHPDVKLAFQPGTFQIKLGVQKLQKIYERTEVFFCNIEEAKRILGIPETEKIEIKELLTHVAALGPKIVCITDGFNGAYAFDGSKAWTIGVYPHTPYERTGAGDAFASTFTSALILGKTIPEALQWGPINAQSVVQKIGAQKGLLTRDQIEVLLKKAPKEFMAREL
jgi:ribokinase